MKIHIKYIMPVSRKIPRDLDNPFDNILIDIVEWMNPYFKRLHFTPNGITTLSLIFGIIFNIAFYKNYYIFAALSILISYYFDCMDGNYARTYDMQSRFGDFYDHIKDWTVFIIFIIIFFTKTTSLKFKLICIIVLIIVCLGTILHTGCTEEYIRKKRKNIVNSIALDSVSFCPNMETMRWTKYFGCGTLNITIAVIVLLHYKMVKK